MNLVEKVLDGVQNLMNVNSATFSGAVDILVVPQEDGSLACTSWHVRFGKLQLLNTTEKKILIEVNGIPVRGMKMRLGRAGEAYFVGETNELPPPEFRASIDPEHGLSDDEDEMSDIRATHDDWAVHDELHRQAVEAQVDPPVEGDWAELTPSASKVEELKTHIRQRSGDHSRASDSEDLGPLLRRTSAESLPHGSTNISPSPSHEKLGTILLSPSKRRVKDSKSHSDSDRRSDDTRSPSPYASDSESMNIDPLQRELSDSTNTQQQLSRSAAPSSSSQPPKDSKKSWGAALLGFLGKKDQPGEALPSETPLSASHSSAVPIATSGRRTSLDYSANEGQMFGDEIHTDSSQVNTKETRVIQSSSLPSNWGPSPLSNPSNFSSRIGEDDYASDSGGNKPPKRHNDEGKSRAADDGSGVILVGQKRKTRSSSITSATSSGSASHHAIVSPSSSLAVPQESFGGRNAPSSIVSTSVPQDNPITHQKTGHSNMSMTGSSEIPSRSKSAEKLPSTRISSTVSEASIDSDTETDDDHMFEMDEEAYHATNPMSTIASTLTQITALTESAELASRSPPNSRYRPPIEISKCGFSVITTYEADPSAASEMFNSQKLTWHGFNEDPNILFSPDIVFRIGGAYYTLAAAAPMLFSVAIFNTPLTPKSVDRLLLQSKPKSASKSWGRWFAWGKQEDAQEKSLESKKHHDSRASASASATPATRSDRKDKSSGAASSSTSSYSSKSHSTATDSADEASYKNAATASLSPRNARPRTGSKPPRSTGTTILHSSSSTAAVKEDGIGESSDASQTPSLQLGTISPPNAGSETQSPPTTEQKYYVRTLKPSSERLKSLNLQPGPNKVVFSVISRLQGLQQVSSTVYLWDRESKVVISDIDGTITKSDVLGQIFPVFGKDWSHMGVAALFQSIQANGYHILYLTARAIGAASITKGFLTSLQQDSIRLPDGPVFMSPDRLLHSLNREVILRNPEQFKIQCLNEIKFLFQGPNGTGSNPFYAGFGNRPTDALSYTAVGIPVGKTFTINPSGEITGHSKSIQRTYTKINELVEQMFPPYHKATTSQRKPAEQWNDFQFWDTRPQYNLEDLEKELLK